MDEVYLSMFRARTHQFVVRHKWGLSVQPSGLEVDDFDDALTTYCLVEGGGRHLASLRLRPAAAGSMVERHFPSLWRGAGERLKSGTEVTRFCASPAMLPDERLIAVSDLLLGLCRHCQQHDIPSFFGIVFPSVARVLKQAGWPARILDQGQDASGTLLLAEWTANELVAWEIQERRALHEDARRRASKIFLEPEGRLVA